MAKVIIGGQMLSLLLTLLVTPISYSIFDDWAKGRFWKRRGKRDAKLVDGEVSVGGDDVNVGQPNVSEAPARTN